MLSPTSAPSASSSADPDEPGASGAVCSSEPEIRRPPGPRKARSAEDTKPNETRGPPDGVAAAANTAAPIVAPPVGPGDRRRAAGVDLDDREVAVPVDAGDGAAGGAAVGEADRDLAAAQVVGVGEDAAVGDDDAGAAEPGADPDDGRTGGARDGGDGLLELGEDGHGDGEPRAVRVGSNL